MILLTKSSKRMESKRSFMFRGKSSKKVFHTEEKFMARNLTSNMRREFRTSSGLLQKKKNLRSLKRPKFQVMLTKAEEQLIQETDLSIRILSLLY
jgi:hypothetical protein